LHLSVVVHRGINGMTDEMDRPSAKAITALLHEARSLSRRATSWATQLPRWTTSRPSSWWPRPCTNVEQLVRHLMVLQRQLQRREKTAFRRDP
jgi:hypothetical protein